MNNIKACIFDLDGVICDTAKYHYSAWKRLADQLSIPFTLEDNERLKGISRVKSLEIILQLGNTTLSDADKEKYLQLKNEWYLEYIYEMKKDEILPGIPELLDELVANNIKIALGSASKNATLILNQLNITDYFDAIIDGSRVKNAKPDPEVFLKGAEKVGIEPQYCVVFEDAIAGIEAAHNGNMFCIGVGQPETLHMADHVIEGFSSFNLSKMNAIIQQKAQIRL